MKQSSVKRKRKLLSVHYLYKDDSGFKPYMIRFKLYENESKMVIDTWARESIDWDILSNQFSKQDARNMWKSLVSEGYEKLNRIEAREITNPSAGR